MHERFWILIKISLHFVTWGSNWQYPSIGLDNGLVPYRRHAISWTNTDPLFPIRRLDLCQVCANTLSVNSYDQIARHKVNLFHLRVPLWISGVKYLLEQIAPDKQYSSSQSLFLCTNDPEYLGWIYLDTRSPLWVVGKDEMKNWYPNSNIKYKLYQYLVDVIEKCIVHFENCSSPWHISLTNG